jgi:hypothetical protein
MDADVEKLIDSIWSQSLKKISKKGAVTAVRSTLGDDIDICVPQMRAILLIQANPDIAAVIYHSAYLSASRNSYAIMKKLGMPPDYFWKFEYWPKERAYETLRRVINRVFTPMMSLNKEGQLDLTDVDVEHMRFTITVKECAECAGIRAKKGICYYHAGTLAGIIAALVNKELEGFETNCQVQVMNGQACVFLIGRKDDPEISEKVADFLIPPTIITVLDERLAKCLAGEFARGLGNMVNIGYYQLMLTNILASDPEPLAALSFEVGVEHGKRLAAIITAYFNDRELDVIKKYYNKVHQLDVRVELTGDGLDIIITECAEVSLKKKEFLGFLFGELQGLVSTLLESNFAYQDSEFEGNNLRVKLIPQ